MSSLQERLERVFDRHGPESKMAQHTQPNSSGENGQATQDLYLTGSLKRLVPDGNN